MKTFISAILLSSMLAISVHAYDFATENAKLLACSIKLQAKFETC